MGERLLRAIEWLLLDFEARMVTVLSWICRICGITTDELERYREQQKGDVGAAPITHKTHFPPEPRLPPRTAPPPKRKS